MFEELSFMELAFIITGLIITPWISTLLIKAFSSLLKNIYNKSNQSSDENVIFSCWGGTLNGNMIYSALTFFLIMMVEMTIFHKEPKLIFFCIVTLIFIFTLCWNSLTRIELTKSGIAIYKHIFGTDTEIYKFSNNEIKSIHKQLMVGQMFSGGLNCWLIIKLHHGEEILFPPPDDDDSELLFGFLEKRKIILDISKPPLI